MTNPRMSTCEVYERCYTILLACMPMGIRLENQDLLCELRDEIAGFELSSCMEVQNHYESKALELKQRFNLA
jgi:hypothetical protein